MVSKPLMEKGYSLAEEIANSISHGVGLVFGIVGLVLLLIQAVDANANVMAITSSPQRCITPSPTPTRRDGLRNLTTVQFIY